MAATYDPNVVPDRFNALIERINTARQASDDPEIVPKLAEAGQQLTEVRDQYLSAMQEFSAGLAKQNDATLSTVQQVRTALAQPPAPPDLPLPKFKAPRPALQNSMQIDPDLGQKLRLELLQEFTAKSPPSGNADEMSWTDWVRENPNDSNLDDSDASSPNTKEQRSSTSSHFDSWMSSWSEGMS